MASNYKIIFSGPVGAGKTTAISSISDIDTIKTEESATDSIQMKKPSTTVAMDYGAIILKDETRIHLYGTPGQKRFDFMWEILTIGGVGLLLLIDGSEKNALENLRYFLDRFKSFIDKTSVVIGITKQDQNRLYRIEEYQKIIGENQPTIPLFEVDARNRGDIEQMIETLLHRINPKLSF